ncbi:MAG: ABC transporter substrate-binding protein, partial [Chloroflexota bacterium]
MTFRRLPFFMLLALLLVNVAPLAAQDEVECEEGFRPFEHFVETTCIPVQPERIAAIPSDLVATPLLDFGAPVIATNFGEQEDGTIYVRGASDILGEATVEEANLISLGTTAFNFEVLLEANPDLIIGMSFSEDLYDQLSAIAPTILIEWPTPVFEHLELIADAAGISGVYDEQLAEYEARIAEARERIGDPASITISRLDIAADGIWYYPDTGALEQVIADIGFSQPEIQANAT